MSIQNKDGLPRFARSGAQHSSSDVSAEALAKGEAVAHKKAGFTLIELSIVLVIIGLLVGGVLVGQDLIKAAELRKQVSEFQKFSTAVNTFKLNYNCVPGDCVNYAQFNFLSCHGDYLGDGLISKAGIIGGGPNNFFWIVEIIPAIRQLSDSGLLGKSYSSKPAFCSGSLQKGVDFPAMENGAGGFVIFSLYGKNYIRTGIVDSVYTNIGLESYTLSFTPSEAFQISSKISDGTPGVHGSNLYAVNFATGSAHFSDFDNQPTFSAAGGSGCVVGSSPLASGQTFNVTNKEKACNLHIALQ